MKKTRVFLAIALLCALVCPTVGAADEDECTHQHRHQGYLYGGSSPASSTHHKAWWYLVERCDDCEGYYDIDTMVALPSYLEEHTFNESKVCVYCGYVNDPSCKHKETYETEDDFSIKAHDNWTHNKCYTKRDVCSACGTLLKKRNIVEKENHIFERMTVEGQSIEKCTECGYVKREPPTPDEANELAASRFAKEAAKEDSEINTIISDMIRSDYSTYFSIAVEGILDSSSEFGNYASRFLYEALTDPAKKLTNVVLDEKKAVLVHIIKEMMAGEYGASRSQTENIADYSAILGMAKEEFDIYLESVTSDLTRLGEARDAYRYGNDLKIGGYALEVVGLISAGVDIASATAEEKRQMIALIESYDQNMRYLDSLCGATDGAVYEACDTVRREMRMAMEGIFQAADNTRKVGFGSLLAEQLMEKGIAVAGGTVASALLLGGGIGGAITSGTGRYIEANDELLYLGLIKNDVKDAMESAAVSRDSALFDLTELYFAVQKDGMDATRAFYDSYSKTAVGWLYDILNQFDGERTAGNIEKQKEALAENQDALREAMADLLLAEIEQTAPVEDDQPDLANNLYAVAKGSSRIRTSPEISANNVQDYAVKGNSYQIIEIVPDQYGSSDWYKIRLSDGTIGYISSGVTDAVEIGEKKAVTSAPAAPVSGQRYAVLKGSTNIRSSPGIESGNITGSAYKGDSYQILDVVPDPNGRSDWYKIQLPGGGVGYISSGMADTEKK